MKIHTLHAGNFVCDGGALFGAIPKALWLRSYPCDMSNTTKLTMRCLLIDYGSRKLLIEAGVGEHYDDKTMRNNGHEETNALKKSLQRLNLSPDDITDVLFTHLHWDHCNGAVVDNNGKLNLLFPNATHWCSKKQWKHSFISNRREQAAYYRNILDFIKIEGNMQLLEEHDTPFEHIRFRFFNGHTPGNIVPIISNNGNTYIYTGDFIPTSAHIPIIWLASYDLYPVSSMKEKELFLKEAADNDYILLFEHDYYTECATVCWDENRGSYLKEKFNFSKYFS